MDNLSQEIAKIEYERLSAEIRSIMGENNQLARYAVIANATLCAIIVTNYDDIKPFYDLMKWLPLVVSALFSFRIYSLYRRIELISKYMEDFFEKEILKIDYANLGWETHLNKNIRTAKLPKSFAQVATILFWFVLNLLSLIFALRSSF